jgi:2-deoxy-scyllo-inosamine dehydrogenase (SAM-dependent)
MQTDVVKSRNGRAVQLPGPRPPIRYVSRTIAGRPTPVALPLVAEIEINTRCNRRCHYCPVSKIPPPPGPQMMPQSLFEKIIVDLREFDFDGRLSYHLYNEPLLRKDLDRLVRYVAERLPKARQVLYTNGDLLTDERHAALMESGLGSIVVTRHDSDPFPERPHQLVLTPSDLDITNRGGIIYDIPAPLDLTCRAPEEILVISATGDILLCYEDALRENTIGNVRSQSILSIWTSERFVEIRRGLADGRREIAICRRCSNRAHIEPGSSWFAL